MDADDASENPRWYHAADAFERVYAVSDLHGDVGAALTLFQDVLRVVNHANGRWVWTAPPRTAVVVVGDVVDGARPRGSAAAAAAAADWENTYQKRLPDDLYLLQLLNEWASLARAARTQCRLLRCIGNHELYIDGGYGTAAAERLLMRLERHPAAAGDPRRNRQLSFATPTSLYHSAIWDVVDTDDVGVVFQIGAYVFVHAGLTEPALRYLFGNIAVDAAAAATGHRPLPPPYVPRGVRAPPGVAGALAALHAHATHDAPVPDALLDLVETRDLRVGHSRTAASARRLLDLWTRITGRLATALVVGHETHSQTDLSNLEAGGGARALRVFDRELPGCGGPGGVVLPAGVPSSHRPRWFTGLVPAASVAMRQRGANADRPNIAVTVDADGQPAVFHIDVGQSRAWRSVDPHWVVLPQALVVCPRTNWIGAVVAPTPMPM